MKMIFKSPRFEDIPDRPGLSTMEHELMSEQFKRYTNKQYELLKRKHTYYNLLHQK
jgi:hypothetical protein